MSERVDCGRLLDQAGNEAVIPINPQTLWSFLLCCTILNGGLLLSWGALFLFA